MEIHQRSCATSFPARSIQGAALVVNVISAFHFVYEAAAPNGCRR